MINKVKDIFKNALFAKWGVFCVITATLLYVLFLIITNFDDLIALAWSALDSLATAFSPLLIGLVIAYLLSPLVETIDRRLMTKVFFKLPTDPVKLERRKNLRKLISILITFLLILALIFVLLYAFAVMIIGNFVFASMQVMTQHLIDYILAHETAIRSWAQNLPQDMLGERINDALNAFTGWLTENLDTTAIVQFVTGLGGSIFNLLIGIVVSIYLLKDQRFFLNLWRKFLDLTLSRKANAAVTETLGEINGVLALFIRGALLDALIVAILSSIGLSLIGLDFAVFIGFFAGIANIIPYFGPILGMVPAFIVGLFTGGLSHGIFAVVVLLIIQQIDGNLIYPKVVGASTGLHPLFVLLAVTVAGYYGGIVWMIVAVPIASILQIFILKWVRRMEGRKEAAEEPPAGEAQEVQEVAG